MRVPICIGRAVRSPKLAGALLVLAILFPTTIQGQVETKRNLNRLTRLLDDDKPVFGLLVNIAGGGNAPLDGMAHGTNPDIDFVMYDMEHGAFDVSALRTYMQFLLNPAAIAKAGTLEANTPIIVRIPAFASEIHHNTWMVKQVLDSGAHGVILPHTETPEQALTLVRAMRYPKKPSGANAHAELVGTRSGAGSLASRYWGLSMQEYKERAGIWRLDSSGNIIPFFMVEDQLGVANVREIARQLKANRVGAVLWAGHTDLMVSYFNDERAVSKAVDTILAAGKEFGIPVAVNGFTNAKPQMAQGARVFISGGPTTVAAAAKATVGR